MLIENNENQIDRIEDDNIERFFSYFSRQSIVLRALTLNNEQLEGTGPEDHQIRFYQKVLVHSIRYTCRNKISKS